MSKRLSSLTNLAKWQYHVHLVLIAIAFVLIFDLDTPITATFLAYFTLLIADPILHFLFSILPGKLKWDD